MKKSLKTLALGLVTVGMLAACNKPAAPAYWSNDDVNLMKEKMHGLVLPFIATGLEVKASGSLVSVKGGTVKAGDLEAYAAKFTKEDGWTDLTVYPSQPDETGPLSLAEAAAEPEFYEFEKEVTQNGDKRYVNVQFEKSEVVDPDADPDAEKSYEWSVLAGDPYVYSFPALEIARDMKSSLGTDVSIPDPVADHYYYYYHSDEATKQFGLLLRAYLPKGEDGYAGYDAKLATAGFGTPRIEKDEDDNDYKVAGSPDDGWQAEYSYNDERGCLEVSPGNFEGWPINSVNNYLKKYTTDKTFPAYPFNNIGASFNSPVPGPTDPGYDEEFDAGYEFEAQFIVTGGKTGAAAANDYIAYLKDECGFTANGTGVYASTVLASPHKEYMVRFLTSGTRVFVDFGPYVEAISTWARVQELYSPLHTAEGATTMLPAFSGAAYYGVTVSPTSDPTKYYSYTLISVQTEVEGAMEAYAAALVNAGIAKGMFNDNYYDPAGKFLVRLIESDDTDSEDFTIQILYAPDQCDFAFPSDGIKAAKPEWTDLSIPTVYLAGVSWTQFTGSAAAYYYIGSATQEGVTEGQAVVAAVAKIFTDAGWTADPDYPGYYNSSDGKYWVRVSLQYLDSNKTIIGVIVSFGVNSAE